MAQIMKTEILKLRGCQRLLPIPIEVHVGPWEAGRLREYIVAACAVLQLESAHCLERLANQWQDARVAVFRICTVARAAFRSTSVHLRFTSSPRRAPVEIASSTRVCSAFQSEAAQASSNASRSSSVKKRTRPRGSFFLLMSAAGLRSMSRHSLTARFSTRVSTVRYLLMFAGEREYSAG